MKWLRRDWWEFLLAKPNYGWAYCGRLSRLRQRWLTIRCRMNGHKCGIVWYNSYGFEPDMHCENCGDDLS